MSYNINEILANNTGCPKKGNDWSVKTTFFEQTFEIFFVGRLFHSSFRAFSDLKNFEFKGPKSKFEILKNSQKTRDFFFLLLLQAKFYSGYKCTKNPNYMLCF